MSTPNAWSPRELVAVAGLTSEIRRFNQDQHGGDKVFAAVTLYRNGDDVATIDEHGGAEVEFAPKAVS